MGGVILTLFFAGTEKSRSSQADFEQQPPIPESFYVQQLQDTLQDGSNMILRIQYYPDSNLPQYLNLFRNDAEVLQLRDDGVFPDSTAGDFRYASYIRENIPLFKSKIQESEDELISKGGVMHFDGHSGSFRVDDGTILFDKSAFDDFLQVQIYQPILDVAICENAILKQNSLFITDLNVVEDPARTYNVKECTGNPYGAWTFGTIVNDITNTTVTGISTKDFLKEWLRTWLLNQSIGSFAQGNNTFNNFPYVNVPKRGHDPLNSVTASIIQHVIGPWLKRANHITTDIDDNNWESVWDNTNQDSIIVNAPFKLMAIVNRIDLRVNNAYTNVLHNAGETRLIYTLIDPITGKPPAHDNVFGTYSPVPGGAIDWIGMNIIFEYGNPINNLCDLKLFAQQWYDLSSMTLGSSGYNDHLQLITDQVITAGKGGLKNDNQSAINQIRTNEKVLHTQPAGVIPQTTNRELPDWELRQFELDDNGNGYLSATVVTNTPVDDRMSTSYYSFNKAQNIHLIPPMNSNFLNEIGGFDYLEEWIYGFNGNSINRIRVKMGNHVLPESFLAGSAVLHKEMSHYFGLNTTKIQTLKNIAPDPGSDSPYLLDKQIRHQLSLNTCQGCHGGETKTNFTMMYPRGYGEAANYWDAIPDVVTYTPYTPMQNLGGDALSIDNRFSNTLNNTGTTYDLFIQTDVENLDFGEKTSNTSNQIVSPFITGRKYSDYPGLPNPWQDDELDDAQREAVLNDINSTTPHLADNLLTGLYFVNDPSNQSLTIPSGANLPSGKGGVFPQLHTQKWGFNELQRRSDDLCQFVRSSCTGTHANSTTLSALDIILAIAFIPLPLGGH